MFPRSIVEVWSEIDHYKTFNIALDPHILIRYPYAMFYYVRKDNKQLAELIESGFKHLIDTGQFDRLFIDYYGESIEAAQIQSRKIIDLPNPLFPKINKDKLRYYFVPH